MSKTLMTLVGEALQEAGVKIVNNKLVVPESENVQPAIDALKSAMEAKIDTAKSESSNAVDALTGNATVDYDDLGKMEAKVKDIVVAMSTDTERLSAINALVVAYEGADDLMTGLIGGKLGKDESATNSNKLENLTLTQVTDKAIEKFNATAQGTKEEFVSVLTGA